MNTKNTATSIIAFLLTAFALVISITTLTWINRLEQTMCKCSTDFKRDYIKHFLYFYVIFLIFLMSEKYLYLSAYVQPIVNLVKTLMMIALSINTVFAIMYINSLKDCKCSEDIRREIYYVLNLVWIGFVGLAIILGILTYMFGH